MSGAYYNEIDPYCAAWLQNLMDAGNIAPGVIDTRSIEDVTPNDVRGWGGAGVNYLSVCSGIEAATVAWRPLGWNPHAFSEIEKFPSQVLAHHYPEVPNLGDMTKYQEWPDAAIQLLVGGTPCQSFSVAGLRKGLGDPRGNLMLTYGAIAGKYRPRWLVWENVPGVLSSNGGRDFGTFLGMLAELGYGFAYRVLDAQYIRVDGFARAVPQRRRRVFVVGYLGDWRRAAAVLFERESLCGNPAPSRKAGEAIAPTIRAGAANGGAGHGARSGDSKDELIVPVDLPAEVASTLNAHYGDKQGLENQHALNGCQLFVPSATAIRTANTSSNGHGFNDEVSYTLDRTQGQAIAFGWQNSSQQGASASEHCSPTLDKSKTPAVGYGTAVRRLTPIECERLQGFPDGFTDIRHGSKATPDGPRYKALGNSMAIPPMRWIGQRIALVESIQALQAVA